MQHVLTLDDLTAAELKKVLEIAYEIKSEFAQGLRPRRLDGKVLGLLFKKPSLRTRVSFESGMHHLGGSSLYLGQDVGWGTRESIADFSRVVSQYLDVIVCRTHAHQDIVELAEHSCCPIINGLTDSAHPCQAMADVMTIQEHSSGERPLKVAFIGDGNNVSRSLLKACSRLGIEFSLAAPEGYHLEEELFAKLRQENPDLPISQTTDPAEALENASAVYTDVWSSMGFEDEAEQRHKDFADYQVNAKLMQAAPADAIFLHCLPAHRGQEVTDEVIDSPNSRVVEQAANRMHAQKGLLVWLLDEPTHRVA